MAFNTSINRESLISYFPKLREDVNFEIKSDCTPVYNCIAWAMDITDRWVDPDDDIPGHWWPQGVAKDMACETLIRAFEAVGFSVSPDSHYEAEYDKVALYALDEEWTHAAKIISDHAEHSKFGESWDGTHSHDIFQDTIYGKEYAYMKRPISQRSKTEKATKTVGRIKVNRMKLNWK